MLQELRKLPRAMGRCAVAVLAALALGTLNVMDKGLTLFFTGAVLTFGVWCVLNVLGSPW